MEREVLKELVFLTQTDTTVGFVSQNAERLTHIKQRPPHKYYIKAVDSLHTLKSFTRVPHTHRNRLRRSSRTTFIMPNSHSYRVIQDPHHLLLLQRLGWAYTTSANLSGGSYDEAFAKEAADVIIEPLRQSNRPSRILKLGEETIKRIR
jgi:tRNA A37 threonylcarbamoyladenosine synthetase subunit TsaC/SUA5/YrdC